MTDEKSQCGGIVGLLRNNKAKGTKEVACISLSHLKSSSQLLLEFDKSSFQQRDMTLL